jgi:hypothetical protein
MKKIYYILGGLAVIIAAALLVYNYLPKRSGEISFAPGEVKTLSDNAFGKLSGSAGSAEGTQNQALGNTAAKGLGGGGGTVAAPSAITDSKIRSESGGGSGVVGMPYPGPVVYKYIYKGEKLDLSEEKREVFKKNTDVNSGQNITSVLGGMNLGLIDLSKFADANLVNFNLVENKELGYGISVDLSSGFISIYNNDRGWYDYNNGAVEIKCMGPGCGGGNGLDISDVPADEVLIKMANDFIQEKNISISQYGEPRVEDFWRREYALIKDQSFAYVPDVINIIYPLIINDQEVKDMGGGNYGLSISVNIRKNKVSGLYGLGIYNLESSMYEAETDAGKILQIAEQGGYGYYYYPEGADVIEVEIGEPKLVYALHSQYSEGKYSELFVPALSFPILKQPDENYYYRQNIVVPLVKDLLTDENIYPRPMPLSEPVEQKSTDILDGTVEGGAPAGGAEAVDGAEIIKE